MEYNKLSNTCDEYKDEAVQCKRENAKLKVTSACIVEKYE